MVHQCEILVSIDLQLKRRLTIDPVDRPRPFTVRAIINCSDCQKLTDWPPTQYLANCTLTLADWERAPALIFANLTNATYGILTLYFPSK